MNELYVGELERVWRLGWMEAPLDFVPNERRSWAHRFDDPRQRFGTLYCALMPETALREVLADLRPDAAAIDRYLKAHGQAAAGDLPAMPVTAAWRQTHVLAPARMQLDGPIVDLTDVVVRRDIELHHAALLAEHGMPHLDLHEITSSRRIVTQTIAADVHDRLGAAAIRFASRLDGLPCYALFEGRARLRGDGEIVVLTDPPPEPLINVTAGWQLAIQPAPAQAAASRRNA